MQKYASQIINTYENLFLIFKMFILCILLNFPDFFLNLVQ